ncbi:N-acetylmuramoyl-L-alanine amidase [Lysinibacillus sp. LZ02]|uniref:N-acetylmuramoyl-L-alanine amidase n=1 Tax=Lysinibacillus sp. LZ02 TaxID=3420668 RepID=UPI003D368F1E
MFFRRFTLTFIVVIMSMFSIQSAYASQRFADIPTSHEAYEEINYLVNEGVIQGYTENGKKVFKPGDNVKRWQVAKMVINAAGIQFSKPSTSSFTDVKVGSEESMYVETAVKLGIIAPTSSTTFSPHVPITRNEMAKALAVAFKLDVNKYANLAIPFKDVSSSNKYYKYISAIYYNGYTKLTSAGTFLPNNNLTRGQFGLFVARAASEDYRLELPIQGDKVPNEDDAIMQVKANTDNLNVRSSKEFSGSSNILGKVSKGFVFNVYEVGADYYKVDFNGQYAYIYKTYADEVTDIESPGGGEPPVVEKPESNATTIGIATVDNLNIRAEGNASSTVLGKINRGTKVDVLSISGAWAKISYNGTIGYTNKTYLRLMNKSGSPVAGRIIVIDPGHGGKDPGAVSGNAVEKAILLNTANKVKQKLEAAGAIVKMTRTGDTYPSLEERVKFAKDNYGEIFVSIHANSAGSSAQGTETYYSISANDNEKEDYALAKFINDEIVKNAGMKDRGVKREDYYVLRNLYIPAILVELGFVTNSEDSAKLTNDQYVDIFAQSIYNGIVKYYSQTN